MIKKLEKKIQNLEKRMEPVEAVYFYRGDWAERKQQWGIVNEKSNEDVVEHLVRKIKWLEKRMLNLEYECYSKAMKDVPSDEDVSSEDDVAKEVFSVSIS